MLAIVCAGQGTQTPGMLTPWLDAPETATMAASFASTCGIDLLAHGTSSPAETIRDTAIAQPLIVATSLLSAARLGLLPTPSNTIVAGHSVGEFAALALAGVLSPADAVRLVAIRGEAMAAAAALTPTGMSAIVGGDQDEVAAALAAHGLVAATVNAARQVVAAGTSEQLAALSANPPARTRIIPLQVAGAFHTQHMAPAADVLAAAMSQVASNAPRTTLLSNRDGAAVATGTESLQRLVTQITQPVRWDLCLATFADYGVTGVLELAPGGVLAGLAKRALGVATMAIKDPSDIAPARAFIATHGKDQP